jgi:nicotinamidase-related amidase
VSNDFPARGDRTAVLVIDMLNTYDHEDADKLAASAVEAVPAAARLIERAREEDVLLVYVNDNYGDWSTSAGELAERALKGRHPELIDPLLPVGESPFVVKARHSAFYATLLEYLLDSEGVGRLVLTGQATEQCILYTALDAYVRHYQVSVPRDAVAHVQQHLAGPALEMMDRNMHAEITTADEVALNA